MTHERKRWLWSGLVALTFMGLTLLVAFVVGGYNWWTALSVRVHVPAQILLYDTRAIDGAMIAIVVVLYLLEWVLFTAVCYGCIELTSRVRHALAGEK